jgi:hypothetical protein
MAHGVYKIFLQLLVSLGMSSEVSRGWVVDGGGVIEGLVWVVDFYPLLGSAVFSCIKSL